MRAVRIHARQDMRTEQVPDLEPGAGEVRLQVGYVGICGSDLHYYADGAAGIFAIREPLIPGHEVSGVVDFDPAGAFEVGHAGDGAPGHLGYSAAGSDRGAAPPVAGWRVFGQCLDVATHTRRAGGAVGGSQ